MTITKEFLLEQKKDLISKKDSAFVAFNQISGALEAIEIILNRLDALDASEDIIRKEEEQEEEKNK